MRILRADTAVPDSIERFVADLALSETGELFNQYADQVPGLDRPGSAVIRCSNLIRYLESRTQAPLALIGEAPSAHGARFSGIAFTAERSLPREQRTSTRTDGFTELLATVLAGAMAAAGLDPTQVLLWNVVPFHPAGRGDPLRNRQPTIPECALGRTWLERFRALMRPVLVVAVGQTARRTLPPGTPVVRHPANGGKPQLERDLVAIAGRTNRP